MNPFDAIGTARISARCTTACRLSVDYQSAEDEVAIVERALGGADARAWIAKIVELVRRTRTIPTSGRLVGARRHRRCGGRAVARSCAAEPPTDPSVGLDAALMSLSGRVRCARASPARPRRSSPSCGRPCSAAGDEGGDGQEKLAPRPGPPVPAREGGAAADGRSQAARERTTSRRRCRPQPRFEQVSPEVGELDEAGVEEAMADDPDEVLAMLADLTAATDPKLREIADASPGG